MMRNSYLETCEKKRRSLYRNRLRILINRYLKRRNIKPIGKDDKISYSNDGTLMIEVANSEKFEYRSIYHFPVILLDKINF